MVVFATSFVTAVAGDGAEVKKMIGVNAVKSTPAQKTTQEDEMELETITDGVDAAMCIDAAEVTGL